jgi:hypothetical protein
VDGAPNAAGSCGGTPAGAGNDVTGKDGVTGEGGVVAPGAAVGWDGEASTGGCDALLEGSSNGTV